MMFTLLSLFLLPGCEKSTAKKSGGKQSPAKVEAHPTESDIYQLTLTPKAVERLGITTAKVERKSVPRQRTFAGEVTIPAGNSIIVSSPVPGTLGPPKKGRIPLPGTRVEVGQAIFSLVPLLSPERDVPTPVERVQMANARASLVSAQIVAEGDVKQAKAEVDGAQIAFNRAQQLFKDKAGSRRLVDETKATLEIAEQKLIAAQTRKKVLDELTLDTKNGELRTIQVVAPDRGILRSLSATRGQTVTMGMPLFEVVNLDTVWIRVPVYVGQLDQIVTNATALIGELGKPKTADNLTAKPVVAPPSADSLSSTVDLYYEMKNKDGHLHPAERVGVTLPLKGESESLVIPWGAVLYDMHGTAWVYEQTEPTVFRRQRVLVKYVVGELAVLASGPDVDTEIVIDGTAELFGTEFGTGK